MATGLVSELKRIYSTQLESSVVAHINDKNQSQHKNQSRYFHPEAGAWIFGAAFFFLKSPYTKRWHRLPWKISPCFVICRWHS